MHPRVLVGPLEQRSGPHDLAHVEASRVASVPRSGDDAALQEREHGVEQRGMDPQIAVAGEPRDDRLGRRADAHLDGGTVRHQLGDVGSDPALHLPITGEAYGTSGRSVSIQAATRSRAIALSPGCAASDG